MRRAGSASKEGAEEAGPGQAVAAEALNQKGSLFLTRPSLAHYTLDRDELLWRAGDVLGWIVAGALKLRIHKTYKLADAAQAHIDLAARATAGKLLLTP